MKDSNFLRENNARFVWHPMGHPAEGVENPPPIVVGGSGVRIRELDGTEVIDAVAGLWNVNLGFSSEPVKAAIAAQLDELPYYSTFRGSTNDKIIELSYMLREFFREEGIERAFFTSGGSDSVDTALRLARQYHKIRREPGRTKFISLRLGYHGTHFGGASVNGNARFRQSYEPLLSGCFHIPAPHAYRNPFGISDGGQLAQKCAEALDDEIKFQGAHTVAAFIMEPVLGAGGVIVPHESFMSMVREICDRHGVLLIADEVITGFGRTGEWSGSRLWGVRPDMMTIAKAITNGYFPFGAALISEKIADAFEESDRAAGFIGHGYTYSGHVVGAAAAVACLEETKRLNVAENAKRRGKQLFEGLQGIKSKHGSVVGDARGGKGLMAALELVSDPATKQPLDSSSVERIQKCIFNAGVMVRISGSNMLMSPPLIISEQDIHAIIEAIDSGLEDALSAD